MTRSRTKNLNKSADMDLESSTFSSMASISTDFSSTSSLPPGPSGLPVVGSMLEYKGPQTNLKWAEQYGPIFYVRMGNKSLVYLNTIDLVEKYMEGRTGEQFLDRPMGPAAFGEGLLYGSGHKWTRNKRAFMKAMHTSTLLEDMEGAVQSELTIALEELHRKATKGRPMKIGDTLLPACANVVSGFLLGGSLPRVCPERESLHKIVKNLEGVNLNSKLTQLTIKHPRMREPLKRLLFQDIVDVHGTSRRLQRLIRQWIRQTRTGIMYTSPGSPPQCPFHFPTPPEIASPQEKNGPGVKRKLSLTLPSPHNTAISETSSTAQPSPHNTAISENVPEHILKTSSTAQPSPHNTAILKTSSTAQPSPHNTAILETSSTAQPSPHNTAVSENVPEHILETSSTAQDPKDLSDFPDTQQDEELDSEEEDGISSRPLTRHFISTESLLTVPLDDSRAEDIIQKEAHLASLGFSSVAAGEQPFEPVEPSALVDTPDCPKTPITEFQWQFGRPMSINEHHHSILQRILAQPEFAGVTEDNDQELLQSLVDMFFGGVTTVLSGLEFVLMYLSKNPTMQMLAQQEIARVLAEMTTPDHTYIKITWSMREKMPYLRACVTEGLRLGCVTPSSLPHVATSDTEIEEFIIPKNTFVLAGLYSIHRDPKEYIDASEFRPQRHLDEHGNFTVPRSYRPFGVGARRCVGETLAEMELFVFTAAILREFDIVSPPGSKKASQMETHMRIVHRLKDFKCLLQKRK